MTQCLVLQGQNNMKPAELSGEIPAFCKCSVLTSCETCDICTGGETKLFGKKGLRYAVNQVQGWAWTTALHSPEATNTLR